MLDQNTRKRPLSPDGSEPENRKIAKTTHEYQEAQESDEEQLNDLEEKNKNETVAVMSFLADTEQEEDLYGEKVDLITSTNNSSSSSNSSQSFQQITFSISYEMQRIYKESLFNMNRWENSSNAPYASNSSIHTFSYLNSDDNSCLYRQNYDHSADYFIKWCSAVELYGCYASKQYQLEAPIFSYDDYKSAKIDFHAFFILESETIDQILLFDNYETEHKKDVQLRFSWTHPLAKKNVSRDVYKNTSTKNFILQKLGFRIENKEIQVDGEEESATTWMFDEMLSKHADEKKSDEELKQKKPPCLEEKNVIMNFSAVHEFMRSPVKTTFENLQKKHAGVFDVRGAVVPLVGKTQIPILNRNEWENLLPITNSDRSPIGNAEYICLLASGSIPPAAQEIAKQYSKHLKAEEGYDFSIYEGSKKNEHEIFFILKADYSVCIGVFIFKKEIDQTKFFKTAQKEYDSYIQKKKINEADAPELFKKKLESNMRKFENAEKEASPFIGAGYYGDQLAELCPNYGKYSSKISMFRGISFFSKAKSKLPPDMTIQFCLSVAWIHPFHRRQGILTKLWPIFQNRYGVFNIDQPSLAMTRFTEKHSAGNISLRSGKYFVC